MTNVLSGPSAEDYAKLEALAAQQNTTLPEVLQNPVQDTGYTVYLTGPTNIVCRGEATDENCRFCAAERM